MVGEVTPSSLIGTIGINSVLAMSSAADCGLWTDERTFTSKSDTNQSTEWTTAEITFAVDGYGDKTGSRACVADITRGDVWLSVCADVAAELALWR